VAPIFFAVVFATIEGGLLLYSINTMDNVVTAGASQLAEYGNTPACSGSDHIVRRCGVDGLRRA